MIDITKILDLEKVRKVYENRIDSCHEGINNANLLYKDNPDHRHELIDTYNTLIERYKKIIDIINDKQKRIEDDLICWDSWWNGSEIEDNG